jgi:hypothetical protein
MTLRDKTSPKAKASAIIDPDTLDDSDGEDEAGPHTPFDDERTIEERADGYDFDPDDGLVMCECRVWPCRHNNPG